MLPISPNSSLRPFNAQSVLETTQDSTGATPQSPSGDTFTAAGSSLAGRTKKPQSSLPISQRKSSPAEQRWNAWINASNISDAEKQMRQVLAAHLKGRIEFIGEHIIIQSDLKCVGFTSLPANLVVEGYLDIRDCSDLISLPAGLEVGSYLEIKDCPCLISLPAGLEVGSYLEIKDCPGFTSLPAGLKVEGYLKIWNCSGLTSLPFSILQTRPRSDGRRRCIYLENTGITHETRSRIEAWLAEHPNPGLQLFWSERRGPTI